MAAPVNGCTYAATASGWVAKGRATLPGSATVAREDRPLGSYVPGITPDTTGPHQGTVLVDVEANTSGFVMLAPGDYHGKRFWGAVRPNGPGVVRLFDCELANMDPRRLEAGGGQVGAVHNVDFDDRFVELYDCKVAANLWHDLRGINVVITMTSTGTTFLAPTSIYGVGLRGRNIKARRCEIVGWQDNITVLGNGWDVWLCWAHYGFYAKGGVGTSSDGQTHTDDCQYHYGKHHSWRFNYFGGPRIVDGYNAPAPGYNAGDDCNNAIVMIQQEVNGTDPAIQIDDVLFDNNWFAGSNTTIQTNYKNGNTLAGVTFSNNKFLRSGTTTPIRNDAGAAYIYNKTALAITYSGNVLWDWDGPIEGSGQPVPIKNVA